MKIKKSGKKTGFVWRRAFSLLLTMAMLPVLPSVVQAEQQAQTVYLVNEDYAQEITDPSAHSVPSIGEWEKDQKTAEITYKDGRVYLDKQTDGKSAADLIVPLSAGDADGSEPAAQGTPPTDVYVEFNWQAHNTGMRLYLRGLTQEGKAVNLFYFSQSGSKLRYSRNDNQSPVTSALDIKITDVHTIRLLLQRTGNTYAIAKSWINGVFDKSVNLTAPADCVGLYALVTDERRTSGTGLGTSFGGLRVWQPAEVQLQTVLDSNPVELSFADICGENTDADAVTESLSLPIGLVLSNGLAVVGWESSNPQVVTNAGVVVRPAGAEDAAVEVTPILAMRDTIGDGSADFEPVDVTAAGTPISITVKANPDDPTPPDQPDPPEEIATTQFLVNEDYAQAITDPAAHSVPSIGEWKEGVKTAQVTYQNGRVYLDKLNSGAYQADLMIPLSKGYVNGIEPASAGTPPTDIYVEFNFQAQNSSTRLYLRGLTQEGKWTNLFYFNQSGSKLQYVRSDNSSPVASAIAMKTTDAHTIRLLLQRKGDTYTIAKSWIDGQFDKDVNLDAAVACAGLYSLVTDERRNSGTGLGSSFGSLRVWQPAAAQLQSMIDGGLADIPFADIKGDNTDAADVTHHLVLQTGQVLASGLTVVGWETSDVDVISGAGVVTRPASADAVVQLTPILSIRDTIGDGGAAFEPADVTAKGKPITVTVRSMQLETVKDALTFAAICGENADAEHVTSDLRLPAQMDGVDIAWQVKSITPGGTKAAVDPITGSVRRPAQDEQDVRVVLTAVLSRGSLTAETEIAFTIQKMTVSDAAYLQQIAQRLAFADICGDNASAQQVRTDLHLANTFGGADIVWSSSNPAVVTETGKVTCPVYPQPDAEVTLTATLTMGGAGPVKKEIQVTVAQGEAVNLANAANIRTNLSGLTADKIAQLVDGDAQTYVEISARVKAFAFTIDLQKSTAVSRLDFVSSAAEAASETTLGGYIVEVSDNGTAWTEVFRGTATAGRNAADFQPVHTRYVRLQVIEKSTDAAERFADIAVRFSPAHQHLVDADAQQFTLDLPSRITASAVSLPVKGSFGSDIEWRFSPDGVFEPTGDGNYKVTHGAADVTVSLTAVFKSGDCTAQVRRTHTVSGKSSGGTGGGSGGGGGGSHSSTGSGSNASHMAVLPQGNIQPPAVQQKPAEFQDLAQAAWATDYIVSLYRDGIVNGKSEGQFAPLDAVTREEFVKMLTLALDLQPSQQTIAFADVDNAAWYAPYLAGALQAGLVQGVSDTAFGVGQPITREDMAVLAARAIRMQKGDAGVADQIPAFGDAAQISAYAQESVALLAALGLVSGNESGDFCPQNHTSRAESAKILYLLRDAVK